MMEYTKLGKFELNVSRICLGCMGFGDAAEGGHTWAVDEKSSNSIIKRALELGVNFFDTAASYQNGTSEQHTGKALRELTRRDEIVVATKFFPRSEEEIKNGISGKQRGGFSVPGLVEYRRDTDALLQRVGGNHGTGCPI